MKSRFTDEQIIRILREQEAGRSVKEILRHHSISQDTFYNRFRYYNPEVGRYISSDPIGQAGGINLFSYAFNSPLNRIDPLGLFDPYQFQPSGPVDSTFGFVQNYFTVGAPVNLGDSDLGSAFENSLSVQGAVSGFDTLLDREAKEAAKTACKCQGGGDASTNFGLSDKTGTNVTWEPGLFSVGESTGFSRSGSCSLSVNCDARSYSYSCGTNFGLSDEFADPLDGSFVGHPFELPGGIPFPIRHSFRGSASGGGRF